MQGNLVNVIGLTQEAKVDLQEVGRRRNGRKLVLGKKIFLLKIIKIIVVNGLHKNIFARKSIRFWQNTASSRISLELPQNVQPEFDT